MNTSNEYIQIDLVKVAKGLIRRLWIIILSMLLCGTLLFAYAAFFVTPLYESSVLMYVNNSVSAGTTSHSISSSEIVAAKSLVETYLVILKTRATLNGVIHSGKLDYSYEQLTEMISAEAVNDTEVFSVTVTSPDPREAEHIANTIARVLPDKIADIVDGSSVRIIDYAVVPSAQASPSVQTWTLIGMLLGLLLSGTGIAVIEIFDDRICSKKDLLDNFRSIPLLSVVPDVKDGKQKQAFFGQNPTPAAKDAYKLLRTNLLFSLPEADEGKGCVIGVTSTLGGEGKSTTVIHLAGALAEQGKQVLVVDCNLRMPVIHKRLGIVSLPGLSDALGTQDAVEDYIHQVAVGAVSDRSIAFDVLAAGEVSPNPSELIGSERMKCMLAQLAGSYDFILLDLPPVTTLPDALVAARLADGIVMAVRNQHTDKSSLRDALGQLCLADGRILGFVFNCAGHR